ncbi:hypothetical protein Pd630_LPD04671 [Rhodococcus opacus PD630]|nr:hypothetical protein Pd630_LPD04671 [Rhodococcus opacus PD630]
MGCLREEAASPVTQQLYVRHLFVVVYESAVQRVADLRCASILISWL